MTMRDLSQLPPPDHIVPLDNDVEIISTFWLVVPTLPQMTYNQLTSAFVTYLYNHGLKVVKLDDRDLQ